MTPLLTVIKTEFAREKAVAKGVIAKGYKFYELVERRYIRRSRHAKSRHMVETNVLPGKIIALLPDLALDEMGDIPHVIGIARNGQGEPWHIPESQILEFQDNIEARNAGEFANLITEAERDNQSRRKTGRRWAKLAEWKPQT